jgi:hypothetical protein
MSPQQVVERKSEAPGYVWQPRPINVWEAMQPLNPLQAHIFKQLKRYLAAHGCRFVARGGESTELGPVAHCGIFYGKDREEEVDPMVRLPMMPKPRGKPLVINTLEKIPDDRPLFDIGREQIVRKACHITFTAEGDPAGESFGRVLWASMPGNNIILEGSQEDLIEALGIRILAHCGAGKVNKHVADVDPGFGWKQWAASPVHADIASAAHALGEAGLIENEIPLRTYASDEHVKNALRFLQRSAMGEGMRSQLDPDLRLMGVTTSGGNKIEVSPDAENGHTIPILAISWDGYIRAIPDGCPVNFITPSVETHENAMVYLAGALLNAGLVRDFDSFLAYVRNHIDEHGSIDVLPKGMIPNVTVIDHFHRQPVAGSIRDSDKVEVVYPALTRFPEIDFPCGAREAELHLLSALFKSKLFTADEPLGGKVIIAVLPGHGLVAASDGTRAELTDMLINGMEMEEIVRV